MAFFHNGLDQILSAWMGLMPVVELQGDWVNHLQVHCRTGYVFFYANLWDEGSLI